MADTYAFLNVGCADCSVLHIGGRVIMIDCHQGDPSQGQSNILDFIPTGHIDLLILTHAHYDHFNGLQDLIDNDIIVDEVWESNYERRRNDSSIRLEEWQSYKNLVKKLDATVHMPTRSTKNFKIVGGAGFQFLNPTTDINNKPDRCIHDASLVFTVRKGTMSITFAGDASDWALGEVTQHFDLKPKNILHASHHGSINGAHLDFIKKITPKYTIISTKEGVHDNVPHPTALQRYRNYTKHAVRRTDIDGTRTFRVAKKVRE